MKRLLACLIVCLCGCGVGGGGADHGVSAGDEGKSHQQINAEWKKANPDLNPDFVDNPAKYDRDLKEYRRLKGRFGD